MRAPAYVTMLVLASVIALAGCGSVSRSAAEYISPALYRSVTVTATILTYSGPRIVTRRFTSAVVVTELAGRLNAAPAVPAPLQVHCPEMGVGSVSGYELTFEPAAGPLRSLRAREGCAGPIGISVGGKVQPELGVGFDEIAARLLGLRHMPMVIGLELSRARAVVRSAVTGPRFTLQRSHTENGLSSGIVIDQQPPSGGEVPPGGLIWLTVST